jgi:hypothetical protein
MWSDLTADEQALLELGIEDNYWLVELRGQFPDISRAQNALARLLELKLVTLEHLGKVVSTNAAMAFVADPNVWDDSKFGFDATAAGKALYFGQG